MRHIQPKAIPGCLQVKALQNKFTPCSRDLPEKVISLQLVCQLMLHYIHKSPAPVPILSQINPVHTPHSTPRKSIVKSPIYASVFQVISFTEDCPSNPCTHLSYLPLCSIWPAHLILLDLITQIIFREKYRSWSFSLTVTKNHHATVPFMHISISHLHRTCMADAYTTVPQASCTSLSDMNVWSKFEGFLNNSKDVKLHGNSSRMYNGCLSGSHCLEFSWC